MELSLLLYTPCPQKNKLNVSAITLKPVHKFHQIWQVATAMNGSSVH